MKKKKCFRHIWLLLLLNGLFFSSMDSVIAQTDTVSTQFSAGWLGEFEGTLKIHNSKGLVQELPMKLLNNPRADGSLQWAIQYGEEASGLRDYSLLVEDADARHFIVDEHNSILIDEFQYANSFISWFEVMGSMILVKYTLDGDYIVFEIIAGGSEPIRTTGGEKVDGEDIPEVNSFGVNAYQFAILKRVKGK